jgi:hypothetical protein
MAGLVLTQKTVKFGGIAALALASVVGGYFIASPILSEYSQTQEEYISAQQQLETQQANLSNLKLAQTNYDQVKSIDSSLKAQFPETAQTEEYMNTIVSALEASGLTEMNLKNVKFNAPAKQQASSGQAIITDPNAGAPTDGTTDPAATDPAATDPAATDPAGTPPTIDTSGAGGEFATIEVAMSVTGSPEALQRFMDYLNRADRAFIISTFSISKSGGEDQLALTGKIFVYPAIVTPDEQLAAQNTGTDPNASTDTSQVSPDGQVSP